MCEKYKLQLIPELPNQLIFFNHGVIYTQIETVALAPGIFAERILGGAKWRAPGLEELLISRLSRSYTSYLEAIKSISEVVQNIDDSIWKSGPVRKSLSTG